MVSELQADLRVNVQSVIWAFLCPRFKKIKKSSPLPDIQQLGMTDEPVLDASEEKLGLTRKFLPLSGWRGY